ncbi:unnamed protein product, partial [marine sediment metagenome]
TSPIDSGVFRQKNKDFFCPREEKGDKEKLL